MSDKTDDKSSPLERQGGGGDAAAAADDAEQPPATAAELEEAARQLVQEVNEKRARDHQTLDNLLQGLKVTYERAAELFRAQWYERMKRDAEQFRQRLEQLYELIDEVAQHEHELQQAHQALASLVQNMATHKFVKPAASE